VNWAKKPSGLGEVRCWQGNCMIKTGQILVALKRNDEYALHIKAVPPDGISGNLK
jgi:hypothetical protein